MSLKASRKGHIHGSVYIATLLIIFIFIRSCFISKSVTFARKVSYVDQQSRRKPHNCVSSMGSSDGTTETNLAIDRLIAPSQTPGRSHRRTSSDNTEVRNNERFYKKQPTSATTTLLGSVGNRYKHRDQRSSTKHSSEKVLRNRQNKQDDCPHCPQRSEGFPSQDNRLRDDNIKGNHSSGTMTQQVSSETRFEKVYMYNGTFEKETYQLFSS